MTEFIVGEVSCNWFHGCLVKPDDGILSARFEHLIEVNRQRGYLLHSFALNQTVTGPGEMNDTLIAVFHKAPQGAKDHDPTDRTV